MANDIELGRLIHEALAAKGLETPMAFRIDPKGMEKEFSDLRQEKVEHAISVVMDSLGLDLSDDSLRDTPKRVRKMYCEEIFRGLDYANFPSCSTFENKMGADEVVIVKDIEVKSMCEHHFMPFLGTAICAYIPKDKILGLSKFNRVVDFFARRPQVQERLTEQVSLALRIILDTEDVAVILMDCKHLCTSFRGVEDFLSSTITSKMSGRFREVPELRSELLALTRRK